MHQHYEGPERRTLRMTPAMEAQISVMVEEEVERRISQRDERLMLHMDQQFSQLQKLITAAFPDGDPHGHRMYHEKSIREANAWARIKGEVISKFLTGGLWVAAAWLAFAVWQSFKEGIKS